MTYDYKQELKRVTDYYQGDPLQKRFSLLLTGEIGVGKTFLVRSCRRPVHIDSFDPGGTKCLRDWINKGDIIADTQWEADDPFNPDKFERWKKAIDLRLEIGYFEKFGTYVLDSATSWGDAIMAQQLKDGGRPAGVPDYYRDYNPQKVHMVNYIKKLMRLPCDFVLTGHLKENEKAKTQEFRFLVTGNALVTIPLLFDEIYVLQTEDTSAGLARTLLIEAQGKYMARSRLKANGKLDAIEPADIKALLRKIGLSDADKPKLDLNEEESKSDNK